MYRVSKEKHQYIGQLVEFTKTSLEVRLITYILQEPHLPMRKRQNQQLQSATKSYDLSNIK